MTDGTVSSPSMQSIYLPGNLKLEFYTAGLTDKNRNYIVEWSGVEPDIAVQPSVHSLISGEDRELKAALKLLRRSYAAGQSSSQF